MAEALGISVHTVAAYRAKIMKKCRAKTVAGLVRCLVEHGLVPRENRP